MARTSHHGLHNDVTGFHECAVHEGHSGVKGCGPFALHSPAVGLPGSYQVFDSLQKKEEVIRSGLGRVLPTHLHNIPGYLLYGIWPTATLSGPFVDLLKMEGDGKNGELPQPSSVFVLTDRVHTGHPQADFFPLRS